MFRRKEEGLFDNQADANSVETGGEHHEEQNADSSAAAGVSTQPAATFGLNSSANSSSSAGLASSGTLAQARPNPAAATAPTASSFRPNTAGNAAADASRGRAPEASKPLPTPISLDRSKAGKRILTVGNDILLKGEIATCDRLVIEGQVDASLNDVHTVEISECGSFKGSAQIEDAEIRGLFEGDLTVRGRLVIYATGKVRGKISYGEIEIERGGELSGEIKTVPSTASTNVRHSAMAKAAPSAVKDDKVAA